MIAETTTTEGAAVRFTQREGSLNAILLDLSAREFGIRGFDATDLTEVRMLGLNTPVEWFVTDGMLRLRLPERIPPSPAYVLAMNRGRST